VSDEPVKYTMPESAIPTHWVNLASEAMADEGLFEYALDRLLDGIEHLLR
jgi:hypothetical protein